MIKPRMILIGVLSLLLLIFVIQNSEVVTVKLLFWDFEMSRVVLIVLATMAGFICGYLVARITSTRSSAA